jgi:hypothetical protein
MENIDSVKTIKEIEDYLIPFLKLNPYERSLYYSLFRQTRLIDKEEVIFVISSALTSVGITDFSTRKHLRTMDKKGCIKILEVRRDGLKIKVFKPNEISGCVVDPEKKQMVVDIETINFYNDQNYRKNIFLREKGKCFYCLKTITSENYVLDHLVPQVIEVDNSYRNIVAVCHECNSKKSGSNANDFVRKLYRDGVLSQKELEVRLAEIETVKSGDLKPEI